MASTPQKPAAIYARQSHGKERSIDEQLELGHARCEEEGWPVAEGAVYVDRTSASRFARRAREDWPRLIADLEAGRLGVLWMWESSRGDRDPETWMGLLRRCRDTGTLIYVETHERLYDITRPRDWRTLADEGVDSAYESEKTSLRIQRDLRSNAAKGRPHGVTMYGYERIYDEHTRELLEQREHPAQATVVREVFAAFDRGSPISRIEEDLRERGVRSARGGQWSRSAIRRLLTNPAYIGKRRGGSTMADRKFTVEYDAIWPPIVDEALFWRVQRCLGAPERKATRPGRQRWLLSYLATHAECGAPLSVYGGKSYRCSVEGNAYIDLEEADEYVSEWVIAWVERYGQDALTEGVASDREALDAQAEAGRLQAQLDEMAADLSLSARTLQIREAALLPKIKAAQERARRAALPPALAPFTQADIRAGWYAAPLAARREVLKALVTVSVRRATHRSEPTYERITVKQRD